MEYPTCHLYFLGLDLHTRLKACVYIETEKIQVTSGIFHGISQGSVA